MKFKAALLVLLAYMFSMASGCAPRGDKEVLATIDEKDTVTLKDFNDRIAKLPQRYQDIINKNKKEFLDELIIDTLLYNEAKVKKLDRDKEVKRVMEEARKKILIARLLQDEVNAKVEVTEEEITQYYNENTDKFTTPAVLRASHILVKNEKDAKDILVELSNGRNFEDLARARSVDPTSKLGGDIGYFAKGQLVPEFEDVCFNMKTGEISGIVETKFGYHIIKLTERKEPQVKSLQEVHDAIEQSIMRFKQKNVFSEFIEKLKQGSKITVNNGLLERISKEEKPEENPKENPEQKKES